MDTNKINQALEKVFYDEGARIVFWNDPEKEFIDAIQLIQVGDINILDLKKIGGLEAKIRIERDDPEGRYLLYSSDEEPDYDDDWLLDIRLYSRSFRADRTSVILDELGLAQQQIRQHLGKRRKFFDNKERLQKLKQLVDTDDNELDLDRKMLAVVVKSDQAELFNIVRALFHAMAEGDEVNLDVFPSEWLQIEKFDLDGPFWEMVQATFGYSEENPTLQNLLVRLFVSDYIHYLNADPPTSLQNLQLTRSGTANAVVCLAQWRDSASRGVSYDSLSSEVASKVHIEDSMHILGIEELLSVMTFLEVEKAIVRILLDRVMSTADVIDAEDIKSIALRRQDGHWVSSMSVDESQRKARRSVYQAITVAAEFFALRNKHIGGFHFDSSAAMFHGYEQELYKFDQLYRHFCENADQAEAQGWDVLKSLRGEIEARYVNWYFTNVLLAWGKFVDSGMLDDWRIDGVPNQYRFFEKNVLPRIKESENRRAFVVISDAFRYEIAKELTGLLNSKYRIQAELSSQLGVLPSYTALGMASLMPHKTLEYTMKGDILIDGKSMASIEQRTEILSQYQGLAVKADQLLAMKQEEGREFISGKRVVYVYHDEIDARGDKLSTEGDTFDAIRKSINEIADIVRYIVNNLNGNYVIVTADHGFLFTESPPGETDKSKLADKPAGTILAKKRYLLGNNLSDYDDAWHGKIAQTAMAQGEMEFWIPKGANRFHFVGGARYIHGGAMLQEIVVPVITIKHVKDKRSRQKTKSKNVSIQVLGQKHKITTQSHRFNLVQMEPVSDRAKPITLKIAVFEGEEPITSIESLTFDSSSNNLDERQKSVILTLKDRQYDKKESYRLVLRDAETGIEQQSIDVTIDRAITDDFDF